MNCGLTPAQGRVQFHMERLFKSAGGRGMLAHQQFLRLAAHALPAAVATYTREQCVLALQLIEQAARVEGLHKFRDVRTDWEQLK